MNQSMYVLGINSTYHDSAACLLKDGQIVAAAEEERFTGIRHAKEANPYGSWMLPFNAISWCLSKEDITINQVDHVAFSYKPSRRLNGRILTIFRWLIQGKFDRIQKELALIYHNYRIPYYLIHPPNNPEIRKRLIVVDNPKWRFHFVEHHIAHAASTFLCSPYENAAILSIDGIGETACTLLAYGEDTKIVKLREFYYPRSLGFFYEEITEFLGFRRNNDEYKVMGLSAYGKPSFYPDLERLIRLKPDGEYEVKIDFEKSSLFGCKELKEVLGPPRLWGSEIKQRHKDIAASAQMILEDVVQHLVNWLYEETECENLCIAGGVALNCLMNQKIRDRSLFRNIFVQPAANDAGTAIGAALYVYNSLLGHDRRCVMEHSYLGPGFTNEMIASTLRSRRIQFKRLEDDALVQVCARLLVEGNIIGWFQGAMEWGPRALGNRSILADPRDERVRDRINELKGRERFRPLAPVIPEDTLQYFCEEYRPSFFMTFTYDIKDSAKNLIPAAVHADGTARLQTVNAAQNKLLHKLTKEFENLTGVPALINTSLNYGGKPIACTIDQALDCFYNTGLDYLVMGNCLILKVIANENRFAQARKDMVLQGQSHSY